MFNIEEATELALHNWYPKDHHLHFSPYHPLGKLVGEWGELLDDYMKYLYKPDYEFEPLNELGDVWYYLRILAYQKEDFDLYEINILSRSHQPQSIEYLICRAIREASDGFMGFEESGIYYSMVLNVSYSVLLELLTRFDLTLNQLTLSNWEKLKPGSERGKQWMDASK